MLWTGETLKVGELEENMQAYFNVLQGFLLLSHGSTVGAGPTLSSFVHASVKQVVDSSFKLFKESISLLGTSLHPPYMLTYMSAQCSYMIDAVI